MKRILSFVLVLVMCLSLLAACGEPAETTAVPAGGSVEDAKDYLAAMYKDTDGTVARRDFAVVAVVMIDGVSYPVTWTTDAPDYVTIGAAQNNMVTIDIVEEPAEQVTFKLTGTVTDKDGNPIAGVQIQMCDSKGCRMPKGTGADGTVTFDYDTSDFHVLIAAEVEGYAVDTTEEYWFENGGKELTIVLEKK